VYYNMVLKMNYPLSHTVDTKTKKTKRGKTTEIIFRGQL
jgi:hypothetical protein